MQSFNRSLLLGACLGALCHCTADEPESPPFSEGGSGGEDVAAGSGGAGATTAGAAAGRGAGSGAAGAGRASPPPAAGRGGAGAAAGGSGGAAGQPSNGQELKGASAIIAVGSWGYRGRSVDGGEFVTCRNASTGNDHSPDLLRDIGYGAGVFIAVGGDANAMVMRSLDAVHWQEDLRPKDGCQDDGYPSSCTSWMGGVAFHDGVWLAGGGNGALMRSEDGGLSWEGLHPTVTPEAIRHIAGGSGRFVAGADKGAVYVSADEGESWTKKALWDKPQSEGMRVAHGAGSFIAWGRWWNGNAYDQACFYSTDKGDTWSACNALVAKSSSFVHDGTQWITRAGNGYATSSDGKDWTVHEAMNFPSELLFDGKLLWGRSGMTLSRGASPDTLQVVPDVKAPDDARGYAAGIVLDSNLPVTGVPECTDKG
jgi:hypothetical protein